MFLYTDFDQNLLNERVAQFRDQTQRYLEGKLTEEEYMEKFKLYNKEKNNV